MSVLVTDISRYVKLEKSVGQSRWGKVEMKFAPLSSTFRPALALFALLPIGQALPQSGDWEAEAQKKVDALVKRHGTGTDLALQKHLLQLYEEDQAVQRKLFDAPADKQGEIRPSFDAVDQNTTAQLKEIVRKHGWPTIRLVGIKASQAAATILNHSRDQGLQREWIPRLSKLVEEGEIVGSDLGQKRRRAAALQSALRAHLWQQFETRRRGGSPNLPI